MGRLKAMRHTVYFIGGPLDVTRRDMPDRPDSELRVPIADPIPKIVADDPDPYAPIGYTMGIYRRIMERQEFGYTYYVFEYRGTPQEQAARREAARIQRLVDIVNDAGRYAPDRIAERLSMVRKELTKNLPK